MDDKPTDVNKSANESWLSRPAEERLYKLLFEMRTSLGAIRGATFLLREIEVKNVDNVPEDFRSIVAILEDSMEYINRAFDTVAGYPLY